MEERLGKLVIHKEKTEIRSLSLIGYKNQPNMHQPKYKTFDSEGERCGHRRSCPDIGIGDNFLNGAVTALCAPAGIRRMESDQLRKPLQQGGLSKVKRRFRGWEILSSTGLQRTESTT